MRRFQRIAVVFLLLAPIAAARAEEPASPLPVALEDLELLPVHEAEWAQLLDGHREVVVRLMFLGERARKVWSHLEAREDPQDAGSRKLHAQIARVREDLRSPLLRLLELVRPFGVDEEVLRVLDDTPDGPRRIERQALRVVLHVPRLTESQRALLVPLAHRTEGALVALEHLRGRIDEGVLDADQLALQKRFWRVVDAALDRGQRVALRRRLPKEMAKIPDLFAVLYTLPGLAPSQATRLKALLVELEQSAAPDQAIVARFAARVAEEGVSGVERGRLEREKQAAEMRNVARFARAWKAGQEILTPNQRAELASVPPLLSVQERPGDLKAWLAAFDLDAAQRGRLRAVWARHGSAKGRMLQELARAALMAEGFGPDSPQQETVEILRAQAYAEALVEARRAAHEIVDEVLTVEELLAWVLGGA